MLTFEKGGGCQGAACCCHVGMQLPAACWSRVGGRSLMLPYMGQSWHARLSQQV